MDINNIKFTDKVREIFLLSDQKAKQYKHQHIDNAHVLLSILETTCLGRKLLETSKINLDKLKVVWEPEQLIFSDGEKIVLE